MLREGIGLFSATGANNAVAFGVLVVAATLMPPEQFGTLGLAVALVVLLAGLIDCGTSVALVRFVNVEARTGHDARRAGAAALAWKAALAAALVALALAVPGTWIERLAPPLAHEPALAVLVGLGAGLLGLWTTARAIDQSREGFEAMRRQSAAYAAARVVAFGAVLLWLDVTPAAVLTALYVAPLAVMLLARLRLPRERRLDARLVGVLLRYGAWVGASALCYLALARLPLFVLAGAGTAAELGHYSAALTFVVALALVGDAARTVLLPRLMRARDAARRAMARRALRRTLGAALALGTAGLTLAVGLFELLLGEAYAGGAQLVVILGTATLVTAWLGLHNALLHALGRPELDAAVNAARLLALAALVGLLPANPLALALAYGAVLVAGEIALYVIVQHLDVTADVAPAKSGSHRPVFP